MDAIRDSFLVQHVEEPTHFRANQNPNTLDLIFTNEENMITQVKHQAPLCYSHMHHGLVTHSSRTLHGLSSRTENADFGLFRGESVASP